MQPPNKTAYALVVGSGFAGSLLSWILQRHGRDVWLIDRQAHPRFAIGESSTPTADFLLAYLSSRWSLPELAPLTAFGSWQESYPHLLCGLKRGFSYFGHQPNQPFWDDDDHSRSLSVAASATDEWSDTHWYRADIDAFIAKQCVDQGVQLREHTEVELASWDAAPKQWTVVLRNQAGETSTIKTRWLIDASGGGNATGRWCGHVADDDWMRTRSSAIFGHFDSVGSFSQTLPDYAWQLEHHYDIDNAAQHHVTEEGWFWVLRFLRNRTSVGWVEAHPTSTLTSQSQFEQRWRTILERYPSIQKLMEQAILTDPKMGSAEPKLAYTRRMSRCRSAASGPGWTMLPVAFGFIDPLHSSGIAHSLSGVARLAECLLGDEHRQSSVLQDYSRSLRTELEWLDTLVSGCYAGLPHFECFAGYSMFYFAATIEFEKQLCQDPTYWPKGFLNAQDADLRKVAESMWQSLHGIKQTDAPKWVTESIRQAIEPWNSVGLLSPEKRNRLNHTAPPKRAVWTVAKL